MRLLLTTIAAAALLTGSALAQTETPAGTDQPQTQDNTGTTQGAAAGNAGTASGAMSADDQETRARAAQNAERVGMRDVRILDRVFVVQGTTPQGETVFMIVNPPGALIGLGTPTAAETGASSSSGGGTAGASGNGANAESGTSGSAGANSGSETGTDASGSGKGSSN